MIIGLAKIKIKIINKQSTTAYSLQFNLKEDSLPVLCIGEFGL